MQLREQEEALRERDVAIAVVTFDSDSMAKAYVQQTAMTWPLLIDTKRKLYRAYGMERGDWWSIYGPASIWHYLQLMFRGRRLQRPGKDYRQLGGDVLIDPQGTVRFHFVSESPHDRPSVGSIVNVVAEAAAANAQTAG